MGNTFDTTEVTSGGGSFLEEDIKDRLKHRLGGGKRILELCSGGASAEFDHYHEAIQQALDLFNNYLYRSEYVYRENVPGDNLVVKFGADAEDPDVPDDDVLRVVRVDFTRQPEAVGSIDDPFTLMGRTIVGGAGFGMGGRRGNMMDAAGRVGLGDVYMWKTQKEVAGRVMSVEPDWLWDDNKRWCAIYCPRGPWNITIEKAYPHTLQSLPKTWSRLFLKAAEGYLRLILSDIRGKFGQQVPGPTGTTETDAATQRDRGEKLISEVEETLRSLPPVTGVEFG